MITVLKSAIRHATKRHGRSMAEFQETNFTSLQQKNFLWNIRASRSCRGLINYSWQGDSRGIVAMARELEERAFGLHSVSNAIPPGNLTTKGHLKLTGGYCVTRVIRHGYD